MLVDPDGGVRRFEGEEFRLQSGEPWTSSRSFARYPTAWTVQIPAAGLHLEARAEFPGQELITLISRPAFWEGRVRLEGTAEGRPLRGLGFVERVGFEHLDTLPAFFGAVSRETRRSVQAMLPLDLDPGTACALVSTAGRPDYLEGIDLQQLSRALIRPVRAVADRGGKSWRSYVALACCDAVGGDSQPYLTWLALPELMHVGSLLVDDVQDGSTVRRGGPAAHVLYGEGPSLNAGAACYSCPTSSWSRPTCRTPPGCASTSCTSPPLAAHTGQALDLDGLQEGLRQALERGDGDLAERRVRAVHRLKSAAPAGALARVGAILGRGREEQVQALGAFVEDVGLAFQIVDDVLNLRGFEGERKARGEDLAAGKVTMPVAKAVGRLSLPGRRRLGEILALPRPEWELVQEAIDLIEGCGALDACQQEAEHLIETGWRRLDPLLPHSSPS